MVLIQLLLNLKVLYAGDTIPISGFFSTSRLPIQRFIVPNTKLPLRTILYPVLSSLAICYLKYSCCNFIPSLVTDKTSCSFEVRVFSITSEIKELILTDILKYIV